MPALRGVAPAALGLFGEHRLATLVFQPVGRRGKIDHTEGGDVQMSS